MGLENLLESINTFKQLQETSERMWHKYMDLYDKNPTPARKKLASRGSDVTSDPRDFHMYMQDAKMGAMRRRADKGQKVSAPKFMQDPKTAKEHIKRTSKELKEPFHWRDAEFGDSKENPNYMAALKGDKLPKSVRKYLQSKKERAELNKGLAQNKKIVKQGARPVKHAKSFIFPKGKGRVIRKPLKDD